MLSAKKARDFADSFRDVDGLFSRRKLEKFAGHEAAKLTLKLIAANIHESVKSGFDSCITYYELDTHTQQVLKSHGYTLTPCSDGEVVFHIISWEDASQDREIERQSCHRTGQAKRTVLRTGRRSLYCLD
jgi:hypothetical protein